MAKLDSLLRLFDNSKNDVHLRVGKEVISYCSQQEIFFDEPPTVDGQMSNRQQNLHVWFAAERYLTTTSYYKEALPVIEKALDVLPQESHSPQGIHETLLCDKAYCLFKTSDYTHAVEAGQEAMRLSQQTSNSMQLSRAYLYLSLVNHALRKYDEAKALVIKAVETNEKMGDNMQLHNSLGVACEIFCSALEVDQAIEYGKRAVEAARAINFLPGIANHLTQLSYAYDRKGEYALGLQMADSAIAIVKAQEPLDRNQLALTLEYKSWNLIDIGRNAEAVEALREAIRLEEEVGNTHAAWYDYRTLAEAMAPIDARGALDVLNRYVRMSDTIHAQQLKELMSQANAEFHNDELQEANVESRRLNRIIFVTSLVIFLLLAAVIASLLFAFRQKKRTADTLRRLTEARETFFTNVTHEFRTPLTVVLGIGREFKDTPPTDVERLRETGEMIERQGIQLLTLVNQMLDISKVQSTIGEYPMQQGDIAAVVGMSIETMRVAGLQKGVEVTFETDEGGIFANFVPEYVEKVVNNLVGNALKFTPEGGRVRTTLHRVGDQVELTVEDTGRGIDPEDLPHIFEPFYRADDTEATGSGVGLALVKQIMDAVKGQIHVTSEPGRGTTFRVTAPVGTQSSEVAYRSTPSLLPEDAPSLLIVEDSTDVARYLGHLLETRYKLHFASDGSQGLKMAHKLMPDLIITDIMMPNTDGLQLCHSIREDATINHIPIIVITAKVTDDDRLKGLQEGVDAYLCKPFNEQELYVRIQKLLELRHLMQEKFANSQPVPSEITHTEQASFPAHSASFIEKFNTALTHQLTLGNSDVESIATELHISPSQLRRKMNAVTGMSPKRYIMRQRLEQAHEEIILYPERKLSVIAEHYGFYDLSHFTRLYKEAYGVTPGRNRAEDEGTTL